MPVPPAIENDRKDLIITIGPDHVASMFLFLRFPKKNFDFVFRDEFTILEILVIIWDAFHQNG
jgi:hypothetical protein